MRRLHLVEVHDLSWCPKTLRDGLTDFLEISTKILDGYSQVRTHIHDVLTKTGTREVVDLCSGAGGPWVHWLANGSIDAKVTLTDKFPNGKASERLKQIGISELHYWQTPVDATAVPSELIGLRTIFTAFHHFRPAMAQAVIDDAVSKRQPIGIFELTARSPKIVWNMLLSPLGVLIFTPKMMGVGWKKIFWTYFIPAIPLVVLVDGIVSCLRTYSVEELQSMAQHPSYHWSIGTAKDKKGSITYLIGYPRVVPSQD